MTREDYRAKHRNAVNQSIHLFAVPVFVLGHIVLFLALLNLDYRLALLGLGLAAFSMIVQGRGHKLENSPPDAFDGPGDFVRRIYAEQFYRYWRFLLNGDFK